MCLSSFPAAASQYRVPSPNTLISRTRKRSHSSITTPAQSNPKMNTPSKSKRIRQRMRNNNGPVQFSPCVSMRCFFAPQQEGDDSPSSPQWYKKADIEQMKYQAKVLSKLHNRVRSKAEGNIRLPPMSIENATRFKIRGESLRGMEHVTDVETGRKRRRVQEEAMKAVECEQQRQLVQRVLECAASPCESDSSSMDQVMKIDSSELAKAYGSKTREALAYSKRVADEDARIAAAILAEDLSSTSSTGVKTCVPVKKTNKSTQSSTDPSVAADIINCLLPRTMSRHRNVVSAQA